MIDRVSFKEEMIESSFSIDLITGSLLTENYCIWDLKSELKTLRVYILK